MSTAVDTVPEVSTRTPAQLLAAVREQRRVADAAEVAVAELALEWAYAHPDLDAPPWQAPRFASMGHGDTAGAGTCGRPCDGPCDGAPDPDAPDAGHVTEEDLEWFGIPGVAWDAAAGFGAANGMSTAAGKALIRDALTLAHRLPQTWARVRAGQVRVWRARRVAQRVLGQARDVAAHLDTLAAPVADRVGPDRLEAMLAEAMIRLDPEAYELMAAEADQARRVEVHHPLTGPTNGYGADVTGVGEITIVADRLDVADFDRAVAAVAAALRERAAATGEPIECLDVRRSQAIGVLADPDQALALLADPTNAHAHTRGADGRPGKDPRPRPRPRRQVHLVLHLTAESLSGLDPVAHHDDGTPVLAELVRAWCSRTDTGVRVQPVLDLGAHHEQPGYQITGPLAEVVAVRDRTCVFPWCHRPARACDHDHAVAWDPDHPHGPSGPSCSCNIASLCRHHHNLKTHTGWTYVVLDTHPSSPTVRWTDPTGHHYLRDRHGTRDDP